MAFKILLPALYAIAPVLGNPVRITAAEQIAHGVMARDNTCENDRYATTDVDYYGCHHAHTMDKDEQCLDGMPLEPSDGGCQSYCEVKVTYFYGQEIPYDFDCRADAPCTLTTSESISHTDSWSIEVGATLGTRDEGYLTYNETELTVRDDAEAALKATFNIGATHQWQDSYQHTVESQIGKPIDETRCGHFSWVPLKVRSCGTLTRAEVKTTIQPVVCSGTVCPVDNEKSCDKTKLSTTENWCVETQVLNADKTPMGTDIFVVIDCGTNAPTPDKQDKIYYHHGVSKDTNWVGEPTKARG